MKKLLSLIKTDLNMTFGFSYLFFKLREKKDWWKLTVLILGIVALVPSYIMLINGLLNVYSGLEALNQKSSFLLTGLLISQFIIFIFGIVHIMSKYYFSNDLNILVPLPIKSSMIIGSKFISVCVNEYIVQLVITLPFIIIYGIKSQVGFLFWLYSFLIFLVLPIIPLAIASILVMLLMKYTNIKGKKDLLRGIGYFLLLGIILFLQIKIQSIGNEMTVQGEEYLIKLLEDNSILIRTIGKRFPPVLIGTYALIRSGTFNGFLNLILFIGISISFFVAIMLVSEKIFFSGLIGGSEVTVEKDKSIVEIEKENLFKPYPPYISIFIKEIKMLFRTPIYLFNSIGGVVIVPIILIMTLIINGKEALSPIGVIGENKPYLLILIGAGFIALLGIMSSVGSTTFSREGKNFWILRIIPIKVEHLIIGKVLSSLLVQLIATLAFLIGLLFIFNLTFKDVLGVILLGLLASIPIIKLGMIVDIIRPLLNWNNPQKAIKQNINVIIGMGLGIGYLFIVGITVYYFIGTLQLNINIIYLIVSTILIVSSYLLFIWLKKLCTSQFINLE